MMFIRHEIFARRGRSGRRRNFIIGATIGLLLLITALVYHFVNAAIAYDLAGDTGLTSGDIVGAVTATDGSAAANINRDDKVSLDITFGIDNAKRQTALQGGVVWVYDLSSIVGSGKDFSAVEDVTTPQNIYDSSYSTTEPVGHFTVQNNKITIEITNDDYATGDRTNIRAGVNVVLDLNKVGVGPKNTTTLTLPGSTVDTPDTISFKTAAIDLTESVYDDEDQSFKTGNTNVSIDKNGSGDYIATYTTEFMTDAYFPDLTTTITLTGDQTFVGNTDFVMTTCTSNYCIANSDVETITIPSQYVTLSDDNKTATIQMESFLYDYCEVGQNCTSGGSTIISGYNLNNNMQKNANYSDYYIMYHANLGDTNPTTSSDSYTATATISGTGENGVVSDTDVVSFGANGYVSGSKRGECVSGSEESNGVTVCSADVDGNVDIRYTITVGSAGESLNKVIVEDVLTDNQVLTPASITIKSGDTTIGTISTTCAAQGDRSCINPEAIDSQYSKNDVKLFSYAFADGVTGPITFNYTVRVATDATIGSADINNKVNLTIDETSYNNIWHSQTHYDFDIQEYVHKEAFVQASSGIITWTIRVYGPVTEGQSFDNVLVRDVPSYETSDYPLGSIDTSFTSAVRIDAGGTRTTLPTSDYSVNGLEVTINTIGYGEEVDLIFTSVADATFKENYAGRSVQVQNHAYVDKGNSWAAGTILTPTADTIEKSVEASNIPGYWHDNGSGYEWNNPTRNQSGYYWTAIINANKGAVDSDYEPYFTDDIPAGLYITGAGWNVPSTAPNYTGDSATDISQANFDPVITVYRVVGDSWQQAVTVPVTVSNGKIQPINLAALFNDASCELGTSAPSASCAGVNNASYYISYYTSIANEIHDDYLSAKTFTNNAYVLKDNGDGTFEYTAHDDASITYKTESAIQKNDSSNTTLDDTNTILYVITINSEGYAFNNEGVPYADEASRKKLTFTDTFESDLSFVTDELVANGKTYSSAIVCTDNSNNETNDCSFSYDSETRTITGQIPDGVLRKIQFKAFLTEPNYGVSHDIYNKANLVTDRITFSDDVSKSHIATKPSGWVSSDGLISLLKVDGESFEPIQDAIFNVEDVAYEEVSTGNYAPTGSTEQVCEDLGNGDTNCDFYTDSDGLVEFENLNGFKISNQSGTPVTNMGSLYYWIEKYVPSPYIADEANKHYFMVFNEGSNYTETAANKQLAESVANSIIANSNGEITSIAVLKSSHRWLVTNTEQRVADLEVRKLIKGNNADPDQNFLVTVTATNSDQSDLNGNFRVEYYNVSDPTTTTLTGTVNFADGEAEIELAHNEGVRIVGLYIGGSYSVKESENDYDTTYACQEYDASGDARATTDCAATTSSVTGTIQEGTQIATITNTSEAEVYGKFGNKPAMLGIMTTAGMAMTGFAVVVILRLRRS